MAKKWPFIVLYSLIALGIIFGSFFDLQIDQALYSPHNGFGVFMAALGENTIYLALGFLGGLLLNFELKRDTLLWRRILLIVIGLGATAFGVYYGGKAIISINAYNIPDKWYVGYPIALVAVLGAYAGGFFFGGRCDNPHAIRDAVSLIVVFFVAYLTTNLIKSLNARPRFRWLVGETEGAYASSLDYFHNWWSSASAFRDEVLKVDAGLAEEFKSFPSGHVTSAMAAVVILSYLPRFDSKLMKWQNLFFLLGVAYVVIEAFSRMLIGAHFLSDVSFAALIGTTWFLIMDLLWYHPAGKKKTASPDAIMKQEEKINGK